MSEKKQYKWRKLTGLWAKENEQGIYYTGKLEDGTVVIVTPNNKREGTNERTGEAYNDPDFVLMTPTEPNAPKGG